MIEFPITLAALVIIARGYERFDLKISLDDARTLVYKSICENPELYKDRNGGIFIDCKKVIANLKKDGEFDWL